MLCIDLRLRLALSHILQRFLSNFSSSYLQTKHAAELEVAFGAFRQLITSNSNSSNAFQLIREALVNATRHLHVVKVGYHSSLITLYLITFTPLQTLTFTLNHLHTRNILLSFTPSHFHTIAPQVGDSSPSSSSPSKSLKPNSSSSITLSPNASLSLSPKEAIEVNTRLFATCLFLVSAASNR
jgi:hypothetical protein